jgi:hypothetical protein
MDEFMEYFGKCGIFKIDDQGMPQFYCTHGTANSWATRKYLHGEGTNRCVSSGDCTPIVVR